jgi:predicted RNase H-like nuclease (RuvC/YqgF family)
MQERSIHQERSDTGGSQKNGEDNPSRQTPMGTPVVPQQVEADYRDETIKSFAQNILRLGQECRALADENKELKKKVELLERQVNYWRIEAEVDHGRWQRTLEDLEHLRRLK